MKPVLDHNGLLTMKFEPRGSLATLSYDSAIELLNNKIDVVMGFIKGTQDDEYENKMSEAAFVVDSIQDGQVKLKVMNNPNGKAFQQLIDNRFEDLRLTCAVTVNPEDEKEAVAFSCFYVVIDEPEETVQPVAANIPGFQIHQVVDSFDFASLL